MFRIRSPLQMYTGLEYACATAHCASTTAQQQLHCSNFTATIALQQFHCNKQTATIVLQQFHRSNSTATFTATIALQELYCTMCCTSVEQRKVAHISERTQVPLETCYCYFSYSGFSPVVLHLLCLL